MIDRTASLVMDWIMVGGAAILLIACTVLLGAVVYTAVKDLLDTFK